MNKSKIRTFLAGLTLAGSSVFAQAYQISPTPNFGEINVATTGAQNNIDFTNMYAIIFSDVGTLSNYSTLANYASIQGYDIGTINNYGAINNYGGLHEIFALNNYGILRNYDSMYTVNNFLTHSSLTNFGDLDNYGSLHFGHNDINNNGMMSNYGTIVNEGGGTFSTSATHTFNNIGTFRSDGGILNSGILNNSGALFNNQILDNSGDLTNSGALITYHGNLNNSGMLSNNGIWTSYASDTINNTGTFINNGSLQDYPNFFSYGSSTYTQSAGHTINNGSLSLGSIQINGGSVSGTGSFTGDVTIGSDASVNPGNSPGTLTFNDAFHSSGDFVFEIAGTAAGQYDVLAINGAANFTGGNVEFDFIDGFHASVGDHWDFLLANNVTGWDSLSFSSNVSGLGTSITQDSLGAHLSITSVPEPETYAMFMAGLGVMGFIARRRKNGQS
jgi:hypothetical protein